MAGWYRPIAAGAIALVFAGGVGSARDDAIHEGFPAKRQSCFRRVYDAGHLARIRDQSVVSIVLSRGTAQLKREAIDGPEAPERAVALTVRLRGGVAAGPEPLDCNSRDARESGYGRAFFQCPSLCGRGHVDIVPQGPDRLMVRIGGTVEGRFIADAVGLGRTCRSDAGVVWLGDAAGDRSFVLERAPLGECR